MFKKISPRKENYDPERLKANNFFSAKKANNEFNLMLYLKTLNELFILKQPNRVLAQVAQQTAQLAATCENEFNTSVSKMKQMLKKVKELSQVKEEEDTEQKVRGKELEEQIDLINKGFKAYNSRIVGHTYTYAGVIQFAEGKVPMIKDIIKTSGSGNLKKALTKVFSSILTQLNLIPLGYSDDQLQELFYICQGNSQDIIREAQLMTHYWVPITEGISLSKGSKNFGPLKPGTLLGGHTWEQSVEEKSDEERQTWQLKMPKKTVDQPLDDLFIILVIPKKKIPWFVNSDPTPDIFESQYLPLLQWMVSKNLESISMISELRDSYIKKYSQVVEVVITEKKVREFEANAEQLPQAKYDKILKLVNEIMGITLERHSSISTEKISKQIYNEIVKQTKRDFPNLNMEDQGNKAYTVWRFVQTEIVAKVFADEFQKQVEIEPPKSVVLIIKEEIEAFLKEASMIVPDESYKLTKDGGEINLKEIIKTKKTDLPNEALKALLSISDIVSQNLNQLVDETNTYLARLKQISSIKTEFDVNEIQSKFIVDAIAKLQHVLQTKSSDQNQTA
ncbi:hypothetical protein KKA14_03015, partial [bacterium]|nr:hypothetical protein [bacterium]